MSTQITGPNSAADADKQFEKVLGYLNYSSGKPDVAFLSNLNAIGATVDHVADWSNLRTAITSKLEALKQTSAVFKDAAQADAVLKLVFDEVLPSYRTFHTDLFFHLDDQPFQNVFFLGRVFEATLAQQGPWDETDRVVKGAIEHLNDFLGYRPLAVLENGRRMTPYDHERFRPLPIYIAGAGALAGQYQPVINEAVELLRSAPVSVLSTAHYDFSRMDELAVDVRAYDHDHPMFKRTNYLFGEWDPHHIDGKGYYRRFVIRQIILDALMGWIHSAKDREEAIFDAASVLCGTMLMASAISGDGPNCHDSTITLSSLLPKVARQRDEFYLKLMQSLQGKRHKRISTESKAAQQPFGHVRQSLNLHLAHYGARQVQYRNLAQCYARMGYPEAARHEAEVIPCASARFSCEIQWRLTSATKQLEAGKPKEASVLLSEIEDHLHRAIHCGAFVDPWNILGFAGNFPLFTAREDSIPDHRVENLLDLVERIFGVFTRSLTEAAAQGENALVEELTLRFEKLADYWDQFASYVIDDLPKVRGRESYESATMVATALAEWRAAGEAAGNITFWRKHVSQFNSPKAYACVVEALLAKGDYIAAMSLLVQWLSCAEEIGLESGPYSIHALLIDWMNRLTTDKNDRTKLPVDWAAIRRLFDFLEANAGDYWEVPQLEAFTDVAPKKRKRSEDDWDISVGGEDEEEEDDEDDIFGAAYDGIVFKDSAEDGTDGALADGPSPMGTTEFETLNRQLEPRIKFTMALAQLWQIAAGALGVEHLGKSDATSKPLSDEQVDALAGWWRRARQLERELVTLLDAVYSYPIDMPSGDHDGNVEYDIQLQTKFYLLNTIITAHINCRIAELGLLCLLPPAFNATEVQEDDRQLVNFYRSVMAQDVAEVRRMLGSQFRRLSRKPLLYVPFDNGGAPKQILQARTVQAELRFLLKQLPRLGLFRETWHVVRLAHRMERETRPSQMAVTEFDRIFRTGLRNTMDCLIESAEHWQDGKFSDDDLVTLMHDILSHYSDQWLRHSQTMRLSSVEALRNDALWDEVCEFIKRYGLDLFHPKSLTLGNVRVILHNGVEWYLNQLREQDDPINPNKMLLAIEKGQIDEEAVVEYIEVVYSAIVDKFDRFLEYNTTTTQSDYGDKFHVLLDFLRIEAAYDRSAWERIPEGIAHRSLAASHREGALKFWEDLLEHDSRDEADSHVAQLQELERRYGVHLPTIADRLNERFMKPLAVNRMLTLVEPAMKGDTDAPRRFDRLQEEIAAYMRDQTGSAIDIPQWLQDIEREISRLETPADFIKSPELELRLPVVRVTEQEVRSQLDIWGQSVSGSEKSGSGKNPRRRKSE